MTPDKIERDILIDAPMDRVWAVLTEPQHVHQWFAHDGVEIDLRPGGAIVMRWKEHGTFRATVEEVEPPRLFSYRWSLLPDLEPRRGNSTLVEFSLSPEGNGTRLKVVETGFRTLDGTEESRAKHVDENLEGWSGGLTALADYVKRPAA